MDLDRAIQIAAEVHAGQKDKAGAPYVLHPLRLMMKMNSEAAMIVAMLHDVVEDCRPAGRWTFDRLSSEGFSDEIVEALKCVTKLQKGENYDEFIDRAMTNDIAREVKLADLEDNMNMLRLDVVDQESLERLAKYHRSSKRLRAATAK